MIEFREVIYDYSRFIVILSYSYPTIFLEFEQLRLDNISDYF
jgi:hypothetical protein